MNMKKWGIFKHPDTGKWVVTPPIGTDPEEYENSFASFAMAVRYWNMVKNVLS
jgi:hypothetical protein